jgi:hypothetical protein
MDGRRGRAGRRSRARGIRVPRCAANVPRHPGRNVGWALAYNLVAIPLAASGRLSPLAAGRGHVDLVADRRRATPGA